MTEYHVPFCDDRWNEIIPNLFVGGMWCQPKNGEPGTWGDVYVRDEFVRVYSMVHVPARFGPWESHRDRAFPIEDEPLRRDLHEPLAAFSSWVAADVSAGRKVLVRCQMGLNRSALVAGLAMVWLGIDPEHAVALLRERRSPNALINKTYELHVLRQPHPVKEAS